MLRFDPIGIAIPSRCALCGARGRGLCPDCATRLPPAPDLAAPRHVDRLTALWSYDGPTRDLIRSFKFANHRDAVGLIGSALGQLVDPEDLVGLPTVVTWAPTTAARRRDRGYDQAELLAHRAAREAALPCRRLLRRRPGRQQTGLDRADRQLGPRFVTRRPAPPGVVLIDDVATTGATMSAAALALRSAGARQVFGLVVAVTE